MKSRRIASAALGAAILLGATGCSMISPQATTIPYSPADGVNVPDSGPLQIRNAFLVVDESGENGNFVAAIINTTDDAHTLNLTFGEGDGAIEKSVRVPARSVVSLGDDTTEPLLVEGVNTPAGADLTVFFQAGDGDTVRADVAALDGALPYLAPLVP